jgi:hypothetical protein
MNELLQSSKSHTIISHNRNNKRSQDFQIIGKSVSKLENLSRKQSNYGKKGNKESIFKNKTCI